MYLHTYILKRKRVSDIIAILHQMSTKKLHTNYKNCRTHFISPTFILGFMVQVGTLVNFDTLLTSFYTCRYSEVNLKIHNIGQKCLMQRIDRYQQKSVCNLTGAINPQNK